MPLLAGNSQRAINRNVAIIIDEYHETGKIGTSRPASTSTAYLQASAIAHDKASRYHPIKRRTHAKKRK